MQKYCSREIRHSVFVQRLDHIDEDDRAGCPTSACVMAEQWLDRDMPLDRRTTCHDRRGRKLKGKHRT